MKNSCLALSLSVSIFVSGRIEPSDHSNKTIEPYSLTLMLHFLCATVTRWLQCEHSVL